MVQSILGVSEIVLKHSSRQLYGKYIVMFAITGKKDKCFNPLQLPVLPSFGGVQVLIRGFSPTK